MAQIKIYGLKSHLDTQRTALSNAIHAAVVATLGLPPHKRFHRFFALEKEDFLFPQDRSERYLIIEISMFEGRSVETKKRLIRALFEKLGQDLQLSSQDIEITIFETPRHNWGLRGQCGDEIGLGYHIEI